MPEEENIQVPLFGQHPTLLGASLIAVISQQCNWAACHTWASGGRHCSSSPSRTAQDGATCWVRWAPGHRELGKGLQNHSKVEERAQIWDDKTRAVLPPLSVNQQLPESAPVWENIGESGCFGLVVEFLDV